MINNKEIDKLCGFHVGDYLVLNGSTGKTIDKLIGYGYKDGEKLMVDIQLDITSKESKCIKVDINTLINDWIKYSCFVSKVELPLKDLINKPILYDKVIYDLKLDTFYIIATFICEKYNFNIENAIKMVYNSNLLNEAFKSDPLSFIEGTGEVWAEVIYKEMQGDKNREEISNGIIYIQRKQ